MFIYKALLQEVTDPLDGGLATMKNTKIHLLSGIQTRDLIVGVV